MGEFTNTSTITVDSSTIPWKPECIYEFDLSLITRPTIKKVIFNPPATVVFFTDGTKTVVKCNEDDIFNPWAGLALSICRKIYGPDFHKVFRKYCGQFEQSTKEYKSESISVDHPKTYICKIPTSIELEWAENVNSIFPKEES